MDNIGLTMPLTTGLISRLTSGLTSISSLIQRLFATFDGTDDFISIPAVTAAGDFVSEFEFSATATGTVKMIAGNSANTLHFITFRTDNTIRASVNNVPITSTGTYTDGKLHAGRLVRVGSSIELYIDEILDGTGTESGGFVLDRIGTFQSGGFYSGTLSNINFLSGWVSSDSAINPRYNLDDPDNVARNSNAVLGSEEVTNGDFSNGTTDWQEARAASTLSIELGNLRSTSDSTAIFGVAQELSGLTIGTTYFVSMPVDIGTITSPGTFVIRAATNLSLNVNLQVIANVTTSTTYTGTFEATATTMFVGVIITGHGSGEYFELEPIVSTKEAAGYGTYENFETDFSDRELMTLQPNGDWLGSEVYNNFTSVGTGWSDVGGGQFDCDGTQAGNSDVLENIASLVDGRPFQTVYEILSISAGLSRFLLGNIGGAGTNHSTTGVFTEVLVVDTNSQAKVRADVNFIGSIDNVSVKRILEQP